MDVRTVLAQNIKSARKALHITQEKFAEYADISLPHVIDIERRRTWVSDKTLQNLAKALDREPWELLVPVEGEEAEENGDPEQPRKVSPRIIELIVKKKDFLRRTADEAMEDLILEILREKP